MTETMAPFLSSSGEGYIALDSPSNVPNKTLEKALNSWYEEKELKAVKRKSNDQNTALEQSTVKPALELNIFNVLIIFSLQF